MSKPQSNLGRGLGDLINEVSTVRAVTAPPAAPAAAPAPPPPAAVPTSTPRRGSRVVPLLTILLAATAAVAGYLAWQLHQARHPGWAPSGSIEVAATEPLTPMQIAGDGVSPAAPDWALAWIEKIRAAGALTVVEEDHVAVRFSGPLFVSGTVLYPDGPLPAIASALKEEPGLQVVVLGHVGGDPVKPGGPYRTGDDLAFARSVAVVNFLRGAGLTADLKAGIGPAPYAESDAQAKARNRAVTLLISRAPASGPAP